MTRLVEREQLRHALDTGTIQLADARAELAELAQQAAPVVAGKRRWWRGRQDDPQLVELANVHTLVLELEEELAGIRGELGQLHHAEEELEQAEAACVSEWRMFDPERAHAIDEVDADIARLRNQLLRLQESRTGASDCAQHTEWLVGALRDAVTGTTLAVAFHPDGTPSDGGSKLDEIEQRRRAVIDAGLKIDNLTLRALACDSREITGPDGQSSLVRIADAYDTAKVLHRALEAYIASLADDITWLEEQLEGGRYQREKLFDLP